MSDIRLISFPNTATDSERGFYDINKGYVIEKVYKNGEMAAVGWFKVSKDGELVAEIKESVCDIYY